MGLKKIIIPIIIACVIIAGAAYIYMNPTNHNNSTTLNDTNTTHNALNSTNATLSNTTVNNGTITQTSTESSTSSSSSESSDPEYNSESYVEKWDKSQQTDSDWAYTHDQPTTTDDKGNEYARVYHEDVGESTWEPLSPASDSGGKSLEN